MARVPVDPAITDIKIDISDTETPDFVTIRGIESLEISIDKDAKNIRELGDLYQAEKTSMLAPEISIGGHFVEIDDEGEPDHEDIDPALEELSVAAASGDDVRTIQIDSPLYAQEVDVRVTGDVSTEFKENYEWSFALQQVSDPRTL